MVSVVVRCLYTPLTRVLSSRGFALTSGTSSAVTMCGPSGAEGVGTLAQRDLQWLAIHDVARADVVDHRVAEDVFMGTLGGYPIGGLADDDGQFGFPVGVRLGGGDSDGFVGTDDR